MKEYRIVEKYNGFFSKWYYNLEIKVNWKFLFWRGSYWKYVSGNSLLRHIPSDWLDLNIVDQIKLDIHETDYNN